MSIFKDLLDPAVLDRLAAERRLKAEPKACSQCYRAVLTFLPSVRYFFDEVRERGGQEVVVALWQRIWAAMESDSQLEMRTVRIALAQVPDLRDRNLSLKLSRLLSPEQNLKLALEALDELVCSANIPGQRRPVDSEVEA